MAKVTAIKSFSIAVAPAEEAIGECHFFACGPVTVHTQNF